MLACIALEDVNCLMWRRDNEGHTARCEAREPGSVDIAALTCVLSAGSDEIWSRYSGCLTAACIAFLMGDNPVVFGVLGHRAKSKLSGAVE
jgi:hypothetical protein